MLLNFQFANDHNFAEFSITSWAIFLF